jgi:eukaryotic-like serine/threonine-protein kinase
LFSEIKTGVHMALATAAESRAGERDVYVPATEEGMAHRSWLSPDGKWVLVSEMDNIGWQPCRVVPFDASSSGKMAGPEKASCPYAAWSPDGRWMYFSADTGDGFHIWRQRFPKGDPEQITFGPTEEEGITVAPDGRSLVTSAGIRQGSVWLHDAHVAAARCLNRLPTYRFKTYDLSQEGVIHGEAVLRSGQRKSSASSVLSVHPH